MSDIQPPQDAAAGFQPFTVILMMSDDLRGDEACASDWVRRVWVSGKGDKAGMERMIKIARCELARMFGWTDEDGPELDELESMKAALEPVAIYHGHIFDIYPAGGA